MKQNILQKWVRALRSGRYKQVQTKLKHTDHKGVTRYCCLGVLCDLYSKEKGIKWKGDAYINRTGVLPTAVIRWAGLENSNPKITRINNASQLNDNGKRFKTIARLIEKAQKEKRI